MEDITFVSSHRSARECLCLEFPRAFNQSFTIFCSEIRLFVHLACPGITTKAASRSPCSFTRSAVRSSSQDEKFIGNCLLRKFVHCKPVQNTAQICERSPERTKFHGLSCCPGRSVRSFRSFAMSRNYPRLQYFTPLQVLSGFFGGRL